MKDSDAGLIRPGARPAQAADFAVQKDCAKSGQTVKVSFTFRPSDRQLRVMYEFFKAFE